MKRKKLENGPVEVFSASALPQAQKKRMEKLGFTSLSTARSHKGTRTRPEKRKNRFEGCCLTKSDFEFQHDADVSNSWGKVCTKYGENNSLLSSARLVDDVRRQKHNRKKGDADTSQLEEYRP